jgi:hypothetical protein
MKTITFALCHAEKSLWLILSVEQHTWWYMKCGCQSEPKPLANIEVTCAESYN